MARTETKLVKLGFSAPNFNLEDVISANKYAWEDIKGGKGTVVMFICNHCPFVVHVIDELVSIAKFYQSKGIGFVAICSNDIENYPDDSPENMKVFAQENGFTFPYLWDESQQTAKDYMAECTPDFNVFDNNSSCVYRGQLDNSRPGNEEPVTGENLRKVLDNLLSGNEIETNQKPSIGCNIKWKK